ncbi:disease resistance protein RPS2-like isoform X2 [Quercus robur]|uniref:disease resistance protein RPS2-like isoform X2 n=1 Tax=Quercus robur TaxID=38942 RepID=UPI0021621701|nr:disease resistance protein RPS2-like isoform X2 [Quercus robur]
MEIAMEGIKPIIEKIEENLLERIGQQIGYLIHLNSNVKNLKDQFQKLGDKRHGMQLEIDEAERKGEVMAPEVERWVQNVDNISEGLQGFLEEDVKANTMCLDGWCPNLKLRYSLSRKAKKKTLEIDGLLKDGQFARVSYRPPPQGIGSSGFKVFESRISIVKEVLKALRDNNINMIAICGMGGIGKTTMAKEVAKIAKDDKLFDEVAMAVVSQNQDDKKIQGQIAEMLGLELVEEYSERRGRLKNRITSSKSVLVILDDIWDALDLEAVGIPYGGQHNRCKILLTSRSEDACNQMKSQEIFKIEVLSGEEAWNLFREMAGNCVDTPNLHPIAKEVAKECGGLPVALVTVGRALENKSEFEWSAALQQLKNSIPKNILGLDSKVYSSIKLSYDYLKSDEAKSCFLLCCLFPEDYDIPIEYIVRYGVGQSLLAKIDNVGEARNRVHAIVEYLKRSFLLLDSKEEESVKMHDVVRDVAISIAENHLVQCNNGMEEWPEKETYEHSAISLVSEKLKRHPDGLVCPKLELLQLLCPRWTLQTLPANLFKGMSGLKVLSLIRMSFPSLPESIHVLQNLRALHLDFCWLTDVSAIGALRKLEILSFLGSYIKELPREMGNLSHLKVLDLSKCPTLQRIPPGLLLSLSHLEELYMSRVSVDWEPMEGNKEGANASLAELMSLSNHLMALKIDIPNIEVLPKHILFKNQMIKFQISVGEGMYHYLAETDSYLFKNRLALGRCDIAKSWTLLQLLARREILYLREIEDFKNIAYELDKEGFQCLKVLEVRECKNVEYVIDATLHQTPRAAFPILESLDLIDLYNLKEIYHCQFPERSLTDAKLGCFGNLRSIRLYCCEQLKNVFSLSIARGLVQLQELEIYYSAHMKEIFPKEGEDEKALDKIMFPQLTLLHLERLRSLIGFCTSVGPVQLVQSSLNQEVGSSETDKLTTSEKAEVTDDIQQHTTGSDLLESTPLISHKLFSSTTILWPPNLEELRLIIIDSIEVLFDLEGLKVDNDCQGITILSELKTLTVKRLSKLAYMWKNVPRGIQGFQNLTSINVSFCDRLIYLIPLSIAKLLVKLQSIELCWCYAIKNIVQRDGEEEAADIIVFPKLSSLMLQWLRNLVSFCIEAYSFEWPSIKDITLSHCYNLKTIGSETQRPRKLKKINEELDSRPHEPRIGSLGFLGRCLECVPRSKNYGPMAVSDQGTTNKSQRSYSVKKEGTLTKPKDPRASDINNPSKIWSLFPSNLIECLKNLESVYLEFCDSIEVIFQLEELNVEESHVAPVLDQLRKLHLNGLSKLMHIWKKGPKRIMGFGNLRLLEVKKCNNLTNLFSPSIGKLLVMLEEIKVIGCEKIEELLAIAKQEEEEEEFLFYKVNSIWLEDLPNLQCFCKEKNAFEWPSLKKIMVIGCPNLRTFVPTNLKTPKLEGVYEDKKFRTPQWKGDLNATLEHIFKGKTGGS